MQPGAGGNGQVHVPGEPSTQSGGKVKTGTIIIVNKIAAMQTNKICEFILKTRFINEMMTISKSILQQFFLMDNSRKTIDAS